MWFVKAWRRRSLPVPVILKRFAAPLSVFIFGIAQVSWDSPGAAAVLAAGVSGAASGASAVLGASVVGASVVAASVLAASVVDASVAGAAVPSSAACVPASAS